MSVIDDFPAINARMQAIRRAEHAVEAGGKPRLYLEHTAGDFATLWYDVTVIRQSRFWRETDDSRCSDDFNETHYKLAAVFNWLNNAMREDVTSLALLAYRSSRTSNQYRLDNVKIVLARLRLLGLI